MPCHLMLTNFCVPGFSALHLAILKHRNECAKLLISELGAKAVNALNESGVTAVHLAASAGTYNEVRVCGLYL